MFTTAPQVLDPDHVTWLRVVEPEDEPTAISPPLRPDTPIPVLAPAIAAVTPPTEEAPEPAAPVPVVEPIAPVAVVAGTAPVASPVVEPAEPSPAVPLPIIEPAALESTVPTAGTSAAAIPLFDAVTTPIATKLAVPPRIPAPPASLARGSRPISPRHDNLGKYELRERLGRGSFGVVYLARDPSLDRDIAIKLLRPKHLRNKDIVTRFLQEARTTARIAHPGIVTVYDCGLAETTQGPTAFIAMELLAGESLTTRLERCERLTADAAIEIVRQVASALEAAHRVNVLHRDLKPDNIYLVPDPAMPSGERVKVLDFGLAKLGNVGHTQVQSVFGTPRYMSPEQCRSTMQVDQRGDIYSLGCILFELLVGRPPFDGDVRQVIDRQRNATPPRVRQLVPDCPAALDALIADMLAKDPKARPQTMAAVQRALQNTGATREEPRPRLLAVPSAPVLPARAISPARTTPARHLVAPAAVAGEVVVASDNPVRPRHPSPPVRPAPAGPTAPVRPGTQHALHALPARAVASTAPAPVARPVTPAFGFPAAAMTVPPTQRNRVRSATLLTQSVFRRVQHVAAVRLHPVGIHIALGAVVLALLVAALLAMF